MGLRVELMAVLALLLTTALFSLGWLAQRHGQARAQARTLAYAQHQVQQLAKLLPSFLDRDGALASSKVHDILQSWIGPLNDADTAAQIVGAELLVRQSDAPGRWLRLAAEGDVGVQLAGVSPEGGVDNGDGNSDDNDGIGVGDLRFAVTQLMLAPTAPTSYIVRLWIEIQPTWAYAPVADMFAAAAMVGVICLGLGGLLVEWTVLRPLRRLEAGALRLTQGVSEVAIEEDGALELANLARRFNAMSAALAAQRRALVEQSEQVRRNERLAAIGRVAAGLAHELGNPLAALVGYITYLLDPRSTDLTSSQRDVLTRVATQAERMQETIARLLDKSRPQAVHTRDLTWAEIHAEVNQAVEGHPWLTHAQLHWLGDDGEKAHGDLGLVRQILVNLVLNAGKACLGRNQPAKIWLEAQLAEKWLTITVTDNGPGIPKAWHEQLFDPFFSRPPPTEEGITGSDENGPNGHGLGLAIARGLAQQLGGTLEVIEAREVNVEGEKVGACFQLKLPQASA